MAAMGHVDEVLSLDGPDAEWVLSFPARVHALGPVRSHYGYSAALVPWLRQHAQAFDAVVVQRRLAVPQLRPCGARCAATGVPYVVFPHGMLDPWFKRALSAAST